MAASMYNLIKKVSFKFTYYRYFNKFYNYKKNKNSLLCGLYLNCESKNFNIKKINITSSIAKNNDKYGNYKKIFPSSSIIFNDSIIRSYSTNPTPAPPKRTLPPLMDFSEIVWPSILKSLRNWILSNLVITPYFDRDFSLFDFVTGSKKAVEVVSQKISDSDFNSLEGLVTKDASDALQKAVADMSLAQRQQLQIHEDDIYFSFPYQVGVMFDESGSTQRRFVEITMVYHVLRGLKIMRSRGEEPPLNVGLAPEFRDSIFILNYRFIREFTKGVEDQWTINVINHFKPTDFV